MEVDLIPVVLLPHSDSNTCKAINYNGHQYYEIGDFIDNFSNDKRKNRSIGISLQADSIITIKLT